ncbi:MAG: PQQ-dependent sugar dehydrogenase [Patescibacteria group bacterium]
MKKVFIAILILVSSIIIVGIFLYKNFSGVKPVITPAPADIAKEIEDHNDVPPGVNDTDFPLSLPDGFRIEVFAKNLPGARVMQFVPQVIAGNGLLLLSQTSAGVVSSLEIENGLVARNQSILKGLRKPHGLITWQSEAGEFWLYVAEEDKISRAPLYSAGEIELQKIVELPSGSGHFTRTLGFGPDSRLYVSIGSSCNVCNEKDGRRAKIFTLNPDGTDFKSFAHGLRNTVFFTWHPVTKQMWGTDMGRDLLGDDLPPDEINIIGPDPSSRSGQAPLVPDYGWPVCYGKNIHDTNFDKNTYIRNPCLEPFEIPSHIDLPAHSAPLGLAFVPEDSGWPKEYIGNLLVAFHGSWNRTTPTGYKISRIQLDENQAMVGEPTDFIAGWLTSDNKALGRPVDLKFGPDHALYVSDDKAGVIYRVNYNP